MYVVRHLKVKMCLSALNGARSTLLLRCALWAEPLYHIVDAGHQVAVGQADGRDGRGWQAECALATLAKEVYVLVVVLLMVVVAVAQLVAHAVAAILNNMDKVMLAEERQGPEHTALVNRQNLVFQFG